MKIPGKNSSLTWHRGADDRGMNPGDCVALVKFQTTPLSNCDPFFHIRNGVVEDFG